MIILVRGTNDSGNYADRIIAAMASTAMQKYAKRVLVLQMTTRYQVERVLLGKRIDNSRIKSATYSFEDTGMDALLRRIEANPMTGEQISDCCQKVSKQTNGFDIAGVSKNEKFEEYLLGNEKLIKELFRNVSTVYDVVFVLCNATNEKLTSMLENMIDKEVVCVSQGPKKQYRAREDAYYAVKNFDRLSSFTVKTMCKIYDTKNVFPVPYNIQFKDACLNDFALSFLTMNFHTDETDDNYYYTEAMSILVGTLLGVAEPVIKERNFVYRKVNQSSKTTI